MHTMEPTENRATEFSTGYEAGNYSQAYDGLPFTTALTDAILESECTHTPAWIAGFTLGFYSTHDENEQPPMITQIHDLWHDVGQKAGIFK